MNKIHVNTLSVSSDEGSYCFSFQADLLSTQEFLQINIGTEINLIFYGIEYKCLVEEKKRGIVFGQKTYSISGRAITARLGEGWSNTISRTWPATLARDVVQELCDEVGVTVVQNDFMTSTGIWVIPQDVLSADNEYRISVIQKIVEACGHIVQTTPVGELVILPKYKQPPSIMQTVPGNYDWLLGRETPQDSTDILQLDESYDTRTKYNEVVVMDNEGASSSWSIKLVGDQPPDTENMSIIGIYVFPFIDSVSLYTSSNTIAYHTPVKTQELIEDELVEIKSGEGSTSELIKSVVAMEYIDRDLGTIAYVGNKVTTLIKGQSLIKMSYYTEYHKTTVLQSGLYRPFQVYTKEEI